MDRPWIMLAAALTIVVVAIVTGLYLSKTIGQGGWVRVPRRTYEFDLLPGEEVVVLGYLEANDRVIVAIPKDGEPSLITEAEVDRITAEGEREKYDFRKPGWTHRIQLDDNPIAPSFQIGDKKYYGIVSFGTEAWKAEDVLDEFVGKEVELLGKWDSFTDPEYPGLSITQLQPKSIREVSDT